LSLVLDLILFQENSNMNKVSPGARFRAAAREEKPLQIVGVINSYAARLAERAGFKALYVSGGGVAASSLLPVLVDIDTGWGSAFNIARTIRSMVKSGAAAVHIEDQVQAKRCGHRPGKAIVSKDEMVDRIKIAADAKTDQDFVIMARTDALAVEGLESAIDRASACVEAGADMIFPEAVTDLSMYRKFAETVKVPILANITEFGSTPLYTVEELRSADVSLVLYPLSAFRAMSKAALTVYEAIRREGTQKSTLTLMQTRDELYSYLNYHIFEQKLNEMFSKEEPHE
jgi:methylisocitrate lyase